MSKIKIQQWMPLVAILIMFSYTNAQNPSGELRKWHKITLMFDGPNTSETANPNPFLNYRLNVTFTSPTGKTYLVPGYYAADGNAANTNANSGNKWLVHIAPDEVGNWTWNASFRTGTNVAVNDNTNAGTATSFNGASGNFNVSGSNKTGRDFRAKGRLQYVGEHYLRFAETGEYMIKQGPDSPENLFAYNDFDNTPNIANRRKSYSAHVGDWNTGDPTWDGNKGKGLIGAVNYIASEGLNSMSFLTMNINGDDENVFPYIADNELTRMDVSKLAQWAIVVEHMQKNGIFAHFKTQETENEMLLDNGNVGTQRKLYYRELVARFGHNLALNWNLGEENGSIGSTNQSTAQRIAMTEWFWNNDPYRHLVVIHDGKAPDDLLGDVSKLTGFSLQTNKSDFSNVFGDVKQWIDKSRNAGKKWPVACDEPGDASNALRPDNNAGASHTDGRKNGIWATLLAGGWGNEWYFGYSYPNSDLSLQDFRSRDAWWDYCRYAIRFFELTDLPLTQMLNNNGLSSASNDYCYAKQGEAYVVYLKNGGSTNLNLNGASGNFTVKWYDPRNGGNLQNGTVTSVTGGGNRSLGNAPNNSGNDWVILIQSDSIANPLPPVVNFVNPTGNLNVQEGYSLTVQVEANDPDGSIDYVQLFIDEDFIRQENIAPYDWGHDGRIELNGLAPGQYTFTAVATDNEGNTGEDSFVLTVGNVTQTAPTVNINPIPGSVCSGTNVSVTVDASDQDGTVSSVELFVNNNSVGQDASAPYIFEFTASATGNYNLLAVATDNNNLTAEDNDNFIADDCSGVTKLSPCVVSASSSQSPNLPTNTIDSDLNTRWSAFGDGQTLTLDLCSDYNLTDLKIAFYNGNVRQTNFNIEVSSDNSNWTSVLTGASSSGNTLQLEPVDIIDTVGRFIRYVGFGNSVNSWNSLTEIEVYGEIVNNSQTTTLTPIHDAYLQGNTRFNTSDLRVESGNRTTYLKFDLSDLSGSVTNAELNLTVGSDNGNGTINVYLGNGNNWTENDLSNSNKPVQGSLLSSKNTTYPVGSTHTWDLNSIATGGEISLIVEHTSGNDVSFWSKEGTFKPELVITTNSNKQALEEISIGLYPNPSSSSVLLTRLPASANKIVVYDLSGNEVFSQKIENQQSTLEFNVNKLPVGLYIINIHLPNNQTIKKRLIKD